MAINKKIPSPSEIAQQVSEKENQPSVDTSPKDFTKEEIQEIKNLQTEMNRIIFQLGQLKISEVRLKKAGDNLKNALESAEQKEIDLAQKFSDKYGKGSLDIETGKFTPTE